MDEQVYYKVISTNRTSCRIYRDDMCVTYPLNKWVRPKVIGSKLLIFDNYDSASIFERKNRLDLKPCFIVSCIARYVIPIKRLLFVNTMDYMLAIHYWNKRQNKKRVFEFFRKYGDEFGSCPRKTFGASMVKCLE